MLLIAPALPTPVPLIVIAGPLNVFVPVLLNCSSPPEDTVTPLELAIAPVEPSDRTPAATDVAPVYESVPFKETAPDETVNPPEPLIALPKVMVPDPVSTSVSV